MHVIIILDKARNVDTFVGEKLTLAGGVAVVAAEVMVGADDAVARNDETDRIFAHRATNGLSRHLEKPALSSDDVGDSTIRHSLAEGDLTGDFENATIKRRKIEAERREEVGLATRKILVEPAKGGGQNWSVDWRRWLRGDEVAKVKLEEGVRIAAQKNWTKGRIVDCLGSVGGDARHKTTRLHWDRIQSNRHRYRRGVVANE